MSPEGAARKYRVIEDLSKVRIQGGDGWWSATTLTIGLVS